MSTEQKIEELQKVLDVQCQDGNWDFDPYMHGLANGLIFAMAIVKGEEPVFLEAPNKWGHEKIMRKVETNVDPRD